MKMPPIRRPHKMTITLSDEEFEFRDELVRQLGSDASATMRQGMLELGRSKGLEFPLKKKERPPRKG